jgi:hypothetical protein
VVSRRKRPRHAARIERAGDLAVAAVRSMVPSEQVRLARVQLAWGAALPPHLQKVAWPAQIRGDTLVLHASDNQWLHELSYLRVEVLERLRAHGVDKISDLRLRVGPVQQLPPPPPPPTVPPPPLSAEPGRDTIDAMSAVVDPDLRDAIARARLALGR